MPCVITKVLIVIDDGGEQMSLIVRMVMHNINSRITMHDDILFSVTLLHGMVNATKHGRRRLVRRNSVYFFTTGDDATCCHTADMAWSPLMLAKIPRVA